MATLIYLMLWFGFIALTYLIVQPVLFSWVFFLILVGGFVVYFALTLLLFAISLEVYGRLFKGVYTESMAHHRFVDSYMRLVIRLLRLKLTVTGLENIPDKPFILVANHQANYDTIIHKALLPSPFVFIAKDKLFKWPFIGGAARALGNVPMHRENDRSAVEAIIKGINVYKSGVRVGIYPEGTRSHGHTMLPFKAGALKLATKPKAPILVGVIDGSYNTWKHWPFVSQRVYLHFFSLLEPESYDNMSSSELSVYIRSMIQEKLDEFNQK